MVSELSSWFFMALTNCFRKSFKDFLGFLFFSYGFVVQWLSVSNQRFSYF